VGCTPIHDITDSTKCNKPLIRCQCIGVHISACNVSHCSGHLSVHKGVDVRRTCMRVYQLHHGVSICFVPCHVLVDLSYLFLTSLLQKLTVIRYNSVPAYCMCVCWPIHACVRVHCKGVTTNKKLILGDVFSHPFPSFSLSSFPFLRYFPSPPFPVATKRLLKS